MTPRFGPGVLGGSEAVMAEAAEGFASRGHDVEILTTTALDHYGWANELPEGASKERGLLVRRFRAERRPSRAALAAQLSIQAGRVPDLDHQVSWLGFQFATPGLYEHVLRYGGRYDALIFSPYLFWSTTACLPLVAGRAVVMPCLHDETYARLEILRPVLASPALVWFLSGPEHELAHTIGPVARRHTVTGAGVPVPRSYDPEGFKRRHGLQRPFLLFAGRREGGKGLPMLLEALGPAMTGTGTGAGTDAGTDRPLDLGLDLVLIGKGDPAAPLVVPPQLDGRVIDLGFVDDAERDSAFAAAFAFLQPSQVESFSRTAMEAWLAGRPVVALASNEVLAWHCRRSGGGLLFSDAASLGEALRRLAADPALCGELGANGRRYVIDNYAWPNVLDRMEASLTALAGDAPTRAVPPDAATSRRARRFLVAGSYPPLPGEASAATLGAVRRAWQGGAGAVVVASPRPSAAHHVLSGGKSLGRQLTALRRREACDAVVLCVQPGWPVWPRRGGSRRAARGLANSLLGFAHAEAVVTGTPSDLGPELDALGPVWPAVHRLTASNDQLGAELVARATSAGRAVTVEVIEPSGSVTAAASADGASPPPGPLEPGELLLATRARRALGRAFRKVLGRHAPAVRVYVEKQLRRRRPSV